MRPSLLRRLYALSAFVVFLALACGGDSVPSAPSPTGSAQQPLTVSFTTADGAAAELSVEIADTPAERASGLMFRDSLPEGAGMLFDFGGQTQAGFWMKNT